MTATHKMAEAVSLGMTVPTIVTAVFVITRWGKAMRRALSRDRISEDGWLIIGVVVSFIGSALDNLYWSLPWGASFLGLSIAPGLHESGVFFNIFFRQGCGIAAAYCHLRAADLSPTVHGKQCDSILAYSSMAGVALGVLLWVVR